MQGVATATRAAHSEMTQLGQAKTSRTIESAWWRSTALRGYRTKKWKKDGKLWRKPGSKAALKRSTGKERRIKRQERSISSKNAISHNITCPHALANMQSGHWPSMWSTEFVFMTLTTIWPSILYEFASSRCPHSKYIVQEKVGFVYLAYGSVSSVWPSAWHAVGA